MGERLAALPKRLGVLREPPPFDFRRHLVLDTSKGRRELGLVDVVEEKDAMRESDCRNP